MNETLKPEGEQLFNTEFHVIRWAHNTEMDWAVIGLDAESIGCYETEERAREICDKLNRWRNTRTTEAAEPWYGHRFKKMRTGERWECECCDPPIILYGRAPDTEAQTPPVAWLRNNLRAYLKGE